jgi:DUF4097 and DUF4098 domain-containing protein YvlB
MRSKPLLLIAAVLLASPAVLFAANPSASTQFAKEYTLDIGGEFWVDNPFGDIEIIGIDEPGLKITGVKTTIGADADALREAQENTQVTIAGDQRVRVVRTILPAVRNRWSSNMLFSIRVPRTVNVKVASHTSQRIRVANIIGNVTVKNVNGEIRLDNVTGPAIIDSVNGNIIYDYFVKPQANAQLSTVNGSVTVYVPGDSNFEWVGDSVRGDYLTTMPARVQLTGTSLRASVNAPGGPTLNTASVMQNILILKKGTGPKEARSVRAQKAASTTYFPAPTAPRTIKILQIPLIQGNYMYSTNVGDVQIGKIEGDARIDTGAGSVHLGTVLGNCTVTSLGGPLDFGDILGTLYARTEAGDVIVRAAREGGIVQTTGGIIRVIYTGGSTTLRSGGGDIIVRQASAEVIAETKSGDITISLDPTSKTQKIDAKTMQGNVALNVTPKFAADVDATIMTSDPDANSIHSDFTGLSIKKDQVGSRTRIRATGKINGGGERVELYAEEGDIHILSQTGSPITVMPPQ